MTTDPLAPIPGSPPERNAAKHAELERRLAALERRQFDPAQWGISGAAPFFRPTWLVVGDPGEPAFEPGFAAAGGVGAFVGFWRNPWGEVHLRGQAINSGGVPASLIFILPEGYRPTFAVVLPRAYSADPVLIDTNGEVSSTTPVASTDVVALDGMRFFADQP